MAVVSEGSKASQSSNTQTSARAPGDEWPSLTDERRHTIPSVEMFTLTDGPPS